MLRGIFSTQIIAVVLVFAVSACTGGIPANVSSTSGGFKITPGERISIDLSDVIALGQASDLSITFKQPTDNFSTAATLLDLTQEVRQNMTPDGHYSLILPKNLAAVRPMLLLVEVPSLQAQFEDVLYADTASLKPGIASSLTYELLKYYPGKTFSSYTSADFAGIKQLIEQKIAQVQSETEQLSLSSVRFDRVMRFYKNSMAFNLDFLNAVAAYGVQYGVTNPNTTPTGLSAQDTPEGSLANYSFASGFTVNGQPAPTNPFNETNNPTKLGNATPGIGTSTAQEGKTVSVSASAIDPDDDFIDKSFIIEYTPRQLPAHLPNGVDGAHLIKPEPTPEYIVKAVTGKSEDPAIYESNTIQFNEAINKANYMKGLLADTACQADDTDTDCGETGLRDIYLFVTDGMVKVPYHWHFKYSDVNRPPKIIADSNGHVNDTSLDDVMAGALPGSHLPTSAPDYGAIASSMSEPFDPSDPTAFRQHASHCETDVGDDTQSITSRANGPWSCVFRSYDPDLDDDPNAAVDDYYYALANYEPSTQIYTNGVLVSPLATPPQVTGAKLDTCVDPQGISHRHCGIAQYSITVDNSVKVASATKASLQFSYNVVVTDRALGGFTATKTVVRKVKFTPIPPRLVNFDHRTLPTGDPGITSTYPMCDTCAAGDSACLSTCQTYKRTDGIYIDEILANAHAAPLGTDPAANPRSVGFRDDLFYDPALTTSQIDNTTPVNYSQFRQVFHFQTTNGTWSTDDGTASGNWLMSPYFTQPRLVGQNIPTFDTSGNLLSFTDPVPRMLGGALTHNPPTPTPSDPDARTFLTHDGHYITRWINPVSNDLFSSVIDPASCKADEPDLCNSYDAASYSYPREFDNVCGYDPNNVEFNGLGDPIWDQRPIRSGPSNVADSFSGGWVFEIDAVDLDNLDLRASEPFEPVYLAINHDADVYGIKGLIQYCTASDPNPDTYTYATYQEVNTGSTHYDALNADDCVWKKDPPTKMQPISVFYKKTDGTLRKLVYHRLRVLWKPIDHDDSQAMKDLIRNYLNSIVIYGDRYNNLANKNEVDAKQDMSTYSSLELVAARKNHESCVAYQQDTTAGRYFALHDANTSSTTLNFNVRDENRLGEGGNVSNIMEGRYEAEIYPAAANAAGMTTIDNADGVDQIAFSRFVPFLTNCTADDSGLQPNPPPPVVWYAGETDKLPRARLTAPQSTFQTGSNFPFCFRYNYQAFTENNDGVNGWGRTYDKVALIHSDPANGNVTISKAAVTESGHPCFTQDLHFTATETYALVATPCSSVTISGSGMALVKSWNFDPTDSANGSFPTNTKLRMKLFPAFYGAVYGPNENTLYLDISGVDSFVYDLTSGLNKALDVGVNPDRIDTVTTAANLAPASKPAVSSGMPSSTMVGYVDWDHNPSSIGLALDTTPTPTPDQYFYRVNSSGVLQVFVKGTNGTDGVTIPIKVNDILKGSGLPTDGIESDPFDVVQYVPPTDGGLKVASGATPASTPYYTEFTGRNPASDPCMGAPTGYPGSVYTGTLPYNSMSPYRNCQVKWVPDSNDVGKKYNYRIAVQDNFGAKADSLTNLLLTPPGLGDGAIYPKGTTPGSGFNILNNNWSSLNGPYTFFNMTIESIESNVPVHFYDQTGTDISVSGAMYCNGLDSLYGCAAGSTPPASWQGIFGGTGVQLGCSGGPDSYFNCPTSSAGQTVQSGDILYNTAPTEIKEGNPTTVDIYTKDSNVTSPLKSISVQPPHQVLVIRKDESKAQIYPVPSLTNVSVTTSTGPSGTTHFSINWQPTDTEAYQLSNADGFLIPFVVSDQDYKPATDSQFPTSFDVSHITRTIWVYAKMAVVNQQPQVNYINDSNQEVGLAGQTLTFETGVNKTYKIRIRDTDRARVALSLSTAGFTVTQSGTHAFISDPVQSNTLQTTTSDVWQEFTISNNRPLDFNDIGMTTYTLDTTDPGDPTRCYGITTGTSADYSSCVSGSSVPVTVPSTSFNIEVVGKPSFLVPAPYTTTPVPATDRNTADVFLNTTFNYPLSVSISRASEKGKNFFFGLINSDPVNMPIKTTDTGTGPYIDQNFVFKWPDAQAPLIGQQRSIVVYAIDKDDYCNKGGADYTLYRFNETTGHVETCKIKTTDYNSNLANATLFLNVHANYEQPSYGGQVLPTLSETGVLRETLAPFAGSSDAQSEAGSQYAAFVGRCMTGVCLNTYMTSSGATPSDLTLNPSGNSGTVNFDSSNNYHTQFQFNYDGTNLKVDRTYNDSTPTTAGRALTLTALKGESLDFSASIPSAASGSIRSYYRWYINGCLKRSGQIDDSSSFDYTLPITILMSGLNNDCTGQYSITEANAGTLGNLQVRLTVVNNIEATSTTSDGATESYLWNVKVLNSQPNIQAGKTLSIASGNQSITLAMPISYNSKSYLAYIDPLTTSGAAVRAQEILDDGTVSSSALVSYRSGLKNAPTSFGFDVQGSTYRYAINNTKTYPGNASTLYSGGTISFGRTNSGALGWADVTAYAVFGTYTTSILPATYIKTMTGAYTSSNAAKFYLVDGEANFGYRNVSKFWNGNDIHDAKASLYYGTTPTNGSSNSPLPDSFTAVRKNIALTNGSATTNYLAQLIGASNNSSGSPGWVNIVQMTYSSSYNSGKSLQGSLKQQIYFNSDCGLPTGQNYGPIDGVYDSNIDVFYVLAYATSGTGHVVAITHPYSGSASCEEVPMANSSLQLANPSRDSSDFNPNIAKIALDPTSHFIYGIAQPNSGAPQLYFIDALTKRIYTQTLASTIFPTALIYSKEQNAVFILDGTHASGKVPTTYRIW